MPDPERVVRAAGGVVWRRRGSDLEVVVVHRPAYDDWTFPKGKVDRGESDAEAAIREVREEASVTAVLGAPLAVVDYRDHRGRPKVVRYWAMTVTSGSVGGDNEVDDARWLPVAEARSCLSYERDRPVLDAFEAAAAGGSLDAAAGEGCGE